jgi:hypothetical protein
LARDGVNLAEALHYGAYDVNVGRNGRGVRVEVARFSGVIDVERLCTVAGGDSVFSGAAAG